LLALAISMAAFALPSAQVDRPQTANGNWQDCNVVTNIAEGENYTIITVQITES
jgi:hypothetical protein